MKFPIKLASMLQRPIYVARYLKRYRRVPRLAHPREIFEKILQLSITHRHDPLWAVAADKYRVRDMVRERIGEQYLVPLLGVWDKAGDIDFDALPERFVVKTNNGCASNIIVNNKAELNRDKARRDLDRWLRYPYGQLTGQIHYAHIEPKIIAEEMLENTDPESSSLVDYKIYCAHGRAYYVLVCANRRPNSHRCDFFMYDMDWREHREYSTGFPPGHGPLPRPACLDEMRRAAEKLAEPFEFARIDFYIVAGRPVFGEITLTPGIGAHHTEAFKQDMLRLVEQGG